MNRVIISLVAATLLAACGGGGSPTSGDTLTPAQADAMSVADMGDRLIDDSAELAEILAGINSEADAEAARPRLEAMVRDYEVLQTRLENLDENNLSFGDAAALMRRAPTLAANAQAVAEQIERLRTEHPEASDVLGRILDDL